MLLVCPGCGSRYQVDPDNWPTMADEQGLPVPRPRKVRCRACGQTWMAQPEEDILELGEPLPPDPPARPVSPGATARPLSPDAAVRPLPPSLRAETLAAAPPLPRVAISPSVSGLRAAPRHVEEEEEEERPRRRIWPWLLALLLLAAAVAGGLVWTGVVRTEQLGLPAVDLPPIELPQWADPARLNLSLPNVRVPNVRIPSTPPPPLKLEITAERRGMGDGRLLWDVRGTLANPTERTLDVPAVELVLLDDGGAAVANWTVRPEAGRLAPGAVTHFESSAIDPPASAARVRASLKPTGLGRM